MSIKKHQKKIITVNLDDWLIHHPDHGAMLSVHGVTLLFDEIQTKLGITWGLSIKPVGATGASFEITLAQDLPSVDPVGKNRAAQQK